MAEGDSKREAPREMEPEKLAQLLEIELMQKRASWQQAKARRSSLRAISFLFLFMVIIAALVVFYLFFSSDHVSELRSQNGAPPSPSERSARP